MCAPLKHLFRWNQSSQRNLHSIKIVSQKLIQFSLISRCPCPAAEFTSKHLNALETYNNPRDDGKAAAKRVALRAQGARQYNGYQNTNINHIFLTNGLPMSRCDHYKIIGDVCITKVPVDTYECTFDTAWHCTYKGSLYSHHNVKTGRVWSTDGN